MTTQDVAAGASSAETLGFVSSATQLLFLGVFLDFHIISLFLCLFPCIRCSSETFGYSFISWMPTLPFIRATHQIDVPHLFPHTFLHLCILAIRHHTFLTLISKIILQTSFLPLSTPRFIRSRYSMCTMSAKKSLSDFYLILFFDFLPTILSSLIPTTPSHSLLFRKFDDISLDDSYSCTYVYYTH